MIVINASSANYALHQGLKMIGDYGVKIPSRVGDTIEVSCPVSTVYSYPENMVLISKVRDANPFFHLMESIWILAGRSDVKFLTDFNPRMIDYSDNGINFNAPYGWRLRNSTDSGNCDEDQIEEIIKILKEDPNSRQAVGQIWDPADLTNYETKDKACNMQVVFRVRGGKLCLTVYNRSNDIIWGAYGANIVQFSMLLQYVAARVGIPMGTYTQVSNSYHVYTEGPGGLLYNKLVAGYHDHTENDPNLFVEKQVLMKSSQMKEFDDDLDKFFFIYDTLDLHELGRGNNFSSSYFNDLVLPMLTVFSNHKLHGPKKAKELCHAIKADDWRRAAQDWLDVRIENLEKKNG